jgi:hypothetical protein
MDVARGLFWNAVLIAAIVLVVFGYLVWLAIDSFLSFIQSVINRAFAARYRDW